MTNIAVIPEVDASRNGFSGQARTSLNMALHGLPLPQHPDIALNGLDRLGDLGTHIIARNADPHDALVGIDAQLVHHLPGIIMPGPAEDAFLIERANEFRRRDV